MPHYKYLIVGGGMTADAPVSAIQEAERILARTSYADSGGFKSCRGMHPTVTLCEVRMGASGILRSQSAPKYIQSVHETALRRSRNPVGRSWSSVSNRSETLDTRRDHSRFQPGFH